MPRPRPGYTLLELLTVMTALVVLGAVLVPTLAGINGDTRIKAAADVLRTQIAEARAHAIGEARAYRVSVSADGTHVQVAPDDPEAEFDPDAEPPFVSEETLPPTVQARPLFDAGGAMDGMSDAGGWVRVATFLPDGTCREDDAGVELTEPGCYALRVTVRGLTGAATVTPVAAAQEAPP